MSSFLGAIYRVLRKDLQIERRTKQVTTTVAVFALLVVLTFAFSFVQTLQSAALLGRGALWVAFVFAGTFGVTKTIELEDRNGALDGLLIAPIDRSAIYLGKVLSTTVFIFAVSLLTLAATSVFLGYSPSMSTAAAIVGVLLVSAVGRLAVPLFAVWLAVAADVVRELVAATAVGLGASALDPISIGVFVFLCGLLILLPIFDEFPAFDLLPGRIKIGLEVGEVVGIGSPHRATVDIGETADGERLALLYVVVPAVVDVGAVGQPFVGLASLLDDDIGLCPKNRRDIRVVFVADDDEPRRSTAAFPESVHEAAHGLPDIASWMGVGVHGGRPLVSENTLLTVSVSNPLQHFAHSLAEGDGFVFVWSSNVGEEAHFAVEIAVQSAHDIETENGLTGSLRAFNQDLLGSRLAPFQ